MSIKFSISKPLNLFIAPRLVKGETRKLGVLISCDIKAIDRNTGRLLSSTKSNESGKYILFGTKNTCVVAFDPDKKFNAVIQDNVVPK